MRRPPYPRIHPPLHTKRPLRLQLTGLEGLPQVHLRSKTRLYLSADLCAGHSFRELFWFWVTSAPVIQRFSQSACACRECERVHQNWRYNYCEWQCVSAKDIRVRKGCLKIYNKNWRIDVLTLPAPRTSSTRGRRVARCLSSARKQSYPCPVISRISVDFARDGMLGNTVALRGPDCVGRGIRSIHVCALFVCEIFLTRTKEMSELLPAINWCYRGVYVMRGAGCIDESLASFGYCQVGLARAYLAIFASCVVRCGDGWVLSRHN